MIEKSNTVIQRKDEQSLRLSVTLPHNIHASLERIAKKKKVSLAWVVREAAEKYVSDEMPLFRELNDD
jgi:metal-responsive CopG/Arc/MetJ family transcriptional regulator